MSKKKGFTAFAALTLSLSLALLAMAAGGCGSGENPTVRDQIVDYVIHDIVMPLQQQPTQLVVLQRYPSESTDPVDVNEKMWKIEDGSITEITLDEYDVLKTARNADDERVWMASQHSVRVLDMNEDTGEAIVEVDSLFGPMNMQGTIYRLAKDGESWTIVKKDNAWGT